MKPFIIHHSTFYIPWARLTEDRHRPSPDFSLSEFQLLSLSSEAQLLEEFNRRDDGNAEGFLQDQQIAILSDEE